MNMAAKRTQFLVIVAFLLAQHITEGQDTLQAQSSIAPKVPNPATNFTQHSENVPTIIPTSGAGQPQVPAQESAPIAVQDPAPDANSSVPQNPIQATGSPAVVQVQITAENKPASEIPTMPKTVIPDSVTISVSETHISNRNSSAGETQVPTKNSSIEVVQKPSSISNTSEAVAANPPSNISITVTEVPISATNLTEEAVANVTLPQKSAPMTMPNGGGDIPPYPLSPFGHLTICRVCSCSETHMANPFIINCRDLQLTDIPDYDVYLDVRDSDLDNVQLDMSNNNLDVVSELQASNVIDAIFFDNCGVRGIDPFAFAYLPHLKTLSFARNGLTRLHYDSFDLQGKYSSSLEVLDMSRNQIDSLDKDLFLSTPNLIKLDLHGNPFAYLDSATIIALNGLRNLQYLNVADTGLDTLPMGLTNPLKWLDVLDIGHNRFESLPLVLQNTQNLEKLILDGNPMTELDAATFVGLETLKEVSVSFMPNLKKIYKGTFQLLTELEVLRMHDNIHLETIEPFSITDHQGHGPHLLQLVDISNNKLSTLDEELFESVQVAALNVANNPFYCTCQIAWLQRYWVAETNHTDVRCVGPLEVEGFLIGEVNFVNLPCPDDTVSVYMPESSVNSSLYWTITLLILLFGLAMVVMLVLRSKPEWRYSMLRVITPEKASSRQSQNNDGFESLSEDWIEYQKTQV